MAKSKEIPSIILGEGDKPTKAVFGYHRPGGKVYWLGFVELEDYVKYDYGDDVKREDVKGIYFSVGFEKIESVKAVIKGLETIKVLMESDSNEEDDK